MSIETKYENLPPEINLVLNIEDNCVTYNETGENGIFIDDISPDIDTNPLIPSFVDEFSQIQWTEYADSTSPPNS